MWPAQYIPFGEKMGACAGFEKGKVFKWLVDENSSRAAAGLGEGGSY